MQSQRGGFVLGLIVGLLVGLALALGVALYVTKVPVPFVNKVPQRSAEQDAAEAERNKHWDPNAPLAGKAPARPAAPASVPPAMVPASATGSKPVPRDPAAILAGTARPASAAAPTSKPAQTGADPFIYWVQAGAFQRGEDAEQQRARLGLLGIEAKVVEREQSGRTVYRVRIGPFDKQPEADTARDKLVADGVEAVLVRVERPAQ